MKKLGLILLALIAAFAVYVGVFLVANHAIAGSARDVQRVARDGLPTAGRTLDVLTWNLGYAGLGAESDFVADGGAHTFPPSRAIVRRNADAIAAQLGKENADIILNEEMARGGPVNFHIDLKKRVDGVFANRERIFYADFKTRLMPWPLHMEHGQAIYSRVAVESTDLVPLPAEDSGIMGVRRRYAATVARLPMQGGGGWTVASVHLAAFDENAEVRMRQLSELLAWAQGEYAKGRHVVLGGDWNLRLGETNFPHTTEQKYLFWVFPFPQVALPEGWRIAADFSKPTVRTNQKPFVRGENYMTVIDGFIVSPNVNIDNVEGVDLNFAHSDHNPVRLRVTAK